MQLDTPEGQLTIDDKELKIVPAAGGKETIVSLDPMPRVEYQRGIYNTGTLVVGDATISLDAEQAPEVIEELRRPRGSAKSRKADMTKTDGDIATSK